MASFDSPTLMSQISHNSFIRQLSPFSMNGDMDDQLPSASPFAVATSIVPATEHDENKEQNDRHSIVADHRKEQELKTRTFNHHNSGQDAPLCDEDEEDSEESEDENDKSNATMNNNNTLQQPISFATASFDDMASSSVSKFGLNGLSNLTNINEEHVKFSDLSSCSILKKEQTSAFDVVPISAISSSRLPKMQITNTQFQNEEENEEEQSLPHKNEVLSSTVSQEQVIQLQQQVIALSTDLVNTKQQLITLAHTQQQNDVSMPHVTTPSYSASISSLNHIPPSSTLHNFALTKSHSFIGNKYDVAFLVSQPLLHNTGAKTLAVEPLNTDDEEKAIQSAFKSSEHRIDYIRKFATVNNLRELVTAGTSIIHYCGHGIRNALVFEADMMDQMGMSHKLSAHQLKQLISAGNTNANYGGVQLVFVSACHSQDAGKAFIKAGAKHVIAVQREAEMHDIAAKTFTKQFYLGLIHGKTVKQAFDIANESIKAQFANNSYVKDESQKFVLLPEDGTHDVVLFKKKLEVSSKNNNDQSSLFDHTEKRGIKKFPQPPISEWTGRFQNIHELMHNILSYNLVVISCEKGLGKTAMLLRTLHYLWDRSLLSGIYYFSIYSVLKKNPSLGIAQIVGREMFPSLGKIKTNKEFIAALQEESKNMNDCVYLIVFEDIDLFEYEHLAEDQRIDIFIEEVLSVCDSVKLVLTLGTSANRCTFLHKMDKRILKLSPLSKEDSIRLFERYLTRHFNLNKIRKHVNIDSIVRHCKGFPYLIKYAASRFQTDEDLESMNLRKQLREEILSEHEALRMTRYWKELSLERGRLRIGELKKHIRQRDGQKLWEEMYGYRARGLLNTLLWRMREWYRQFVGDSMFRSRPIWTYYELEFIQMELLPYLAKESKQKFVSPKEVVQRLETNEKDLNEIDNMKSGNKLLKFLQKKKKKKKKKKSKNKKWNQQNVEEDDDALVPEEEKIPIEVFAQFFKHWKALWNTMMEPKISPFYFKKDNEICLIAGMMKKERALSIISQYAKGTFLIRFSKQDADSLVLVVSTGPDQKPSQHKIHIKKNVDSEGITFQYHTVRKGVHESNSLFDLFTHLHFLEHLWYRKRGKDEDFLEMDKRKILKHFRSRADVFK